MDTDIAAIRGLSPEPALHDLERALIALMQHAKDGAGLKVYLCNAGDVTVVRRTIISMAQWFHPDSHFVSDRCTPREAGLAAVENLKLLLDVLREHIKAGNM